MKAVRPAHTHDGSARLQIAAVWLLGIAPIAMLPGLNDRWGWPTLLCVATATVLAALGRSTGALPRWFAALIGIAVILLAVSALTGEAPLAQLIGRAPRYEGMLVIGALVAAGWSAARLVGPQASPGVRRHLMRAVAVASLLLGFVAVLETLGIRPIPSDLTRSGSLAGNATDQAILGAIFAAVLGAVAIGAWRRSARIDWWALSGFIAGVVSVATSASRGGLLALAVVALGLTVVFIATSPKRARDAAVAGGVVLGAFLLMIAIPLTRSRLFGTSPLSQQTVVDRFYMWDDAWALIQTRPWWGVGPNGYADAITPFFGDEWFERADVGAILDSPHNVILQAFAVGGIPGLLLAAVIVGGALLLGIRHARRSSGAQRDALIGSLLAVVGAGTALLTHVTSPTTMVPLAVCVGILVAVAPREPEVRAVRWIGGVLAAAGAVMVVICMIADAALLDARAAARTGDLDRALGSFTTAQTLRPWDVDIALVAASSLGGAAANGIAGAIDPAAEWAQRAVDALPNSARAQYVAGMTASVRGDSVLAVQHLEGAAELSPTDPRIQHELGVELFVSGDAAGARPALERAVELAPYSKSSWAALRDVCAALGDEECARDAVAP
ncbi:O-antigen ligase family protein [Microbacterium sp.]|uniref:O-antigen ligase family protein n=1 Tax=Microbacterium sp. TaxID=51671 RepID=UPI003A9289CD